MAQIQRTWKYFSLYKDSRDIIYPEVLSAVKAGCGISIHGIGSEGQNRGAGHTFQILGIEKYKNHASFFFITSIQDIKLRFVVVM